MSRVCIHVDRLVLRGVPEADRPGVIDRLRRELLGHFSHPGTLSRLQAAGSLASLRMSDRGPDDVAAGGRESP